MLGHLRGILLLLLLRILASPSLLLATVHFFALAETRASRGPCVESSSW